MCHHTMQYPHVYCITKKDSCISFLFVITFPMFALYHFYIQRQSSSAFIYAVQITISAIAIWNICYSLVHDFIRKLWLINIRKKLICEYCRALEMLRYIVCMKYKTICFVHNKISFLIFPFFIFYLVWCWSFHWYFYTWKCYYSFRIYKITTYSSEKLMILFIYKWDFV